MKNDMNNNEQKGEAVPANTETHFSWLRTRMSTERTLESWMRTAVSLIGFGFTMVQFFARLSDMKGFMPPKDPNLPRLMGLLLISIGTAALAVAVWQYKLMLKHLHSEQYRVVAGAHGLPGWSPTFSVAVLLCLVGVAAFVSVIARSVPHP